MRVLVACEFSGKVRDAFLLRGHDAWSCDLLPSESLKFTKKGQERHLRGDVTIVLKSGWWDLIIAFPPCTYLCSSGARWWSVRKKEQEKACDFVYRIADTDCDKIAIENPIGILSTVWRKPDQIIHPWMFGHGETKATCLWLKGLPLLRPTEIVSGRVQRVHNLPPSADRSRLRSITYDGVAKAMAQQWG